MLKEGSGLKKYILPVDEQISGEILMVWQELSVFNFNWILMIKTLCFYSAGKRVIASKDFYGKGMASFFYIKELKKAVSNGHVQQKKFWKSLHSSTKC